MGGHRAARARRSRRDPRGRTTPAVAGSSNPQDAALCGASGQRARGSVDGVGELGQRRRERSLRAGRRRGRLDALAGGRRARGRLRIRIAAPGAQRGLRLRAAVVPHGHRERATARRPARRHRGGQGRYQQYQGGEEDDHSAHRAECSGRGAARDAFAGSAPPPCRVGTP